MNIPKRYTITSALPYANGPIHIGHLAGAYLPADIYARYLRLQNRDLVFICGSDEHGAPITLRAKQEGVSPQEIVDKYHIQMKETFEKFGISFDIFHRTSAPLHHETAQEFFLDLYKKGAFIEKETEQFYDEEFQQFLADRYIKGVCPKCQNPDAYGDQCEKCGSTINALDLKEPISVLSGKTPVLKKTTHWYLPLDRDEAWLKDWIFKGILDGKEQHDPKLWKKNVMGQVGSWLQDGLQARAITRDLSWGVDVPAEIPNSENKKLYVWLDAPIGYISATKQLALDGKIENWEKYWQDEETALIHFIGKDNIVFHTIIFPSILKAKGSYILPSNVPGNEFMNLEGDKISTSRNWAIWVHELVEEHPSKIDAFRFVLCANIPETKDSEFTWTDFQARVNNELVAAFGNFVNRIMVLNHKYYNGLVPYHEEEFLKIKEECFDIVKDAKQKIGSLIENYKFREALDAFMQVARDANKFLTSKEPWKTAKTKPEETQAVLYASLQIVANLATITQVFMPNAAKSIFNILGIDALQWEDISRLDLLTPGHQLKENHLIFEKIEDDFVQAQIEKLHSTKKIETSKYPKMKEEIQFDDFAKIDIRIGTIVAAKKVEKADKLLELSVDMGFETRTIISGIALHFSPEEVVGKQVQVLVNLAPRKMRGVESQGMILFAEDLEGKLHFVSPQSGLENGSSVS
ncbi:MAG: methionine--tRNA ligase [Chitinophagales bacterium]|nr:methionine--tRNA ligase [Bacteroidota bacterium]MCB9256111.1 methionine--tRNA ligase [Chitinophagales bacterium]